MRVLPWWGAAAVLLVMAPTARGGPENDRSPDPRYLETAADVDVTGLVGKARSQPDVTNEVLRGLYKTITLPQLLDGLEIRPKVFEVDTVGGAGRALGISYQFSRALAYQEVGKFRNPLDLGFDLAAN